MDLSSFKSLFHEWRFDFYLMQIARTLRIKLMSKHDINGSRGSVFSELPFVG